MSEGFRNMAATILVIEDDEDVRNMLAVVLELEGYSVATAENGKRAFEILDSLSEVKLILLDLMMPEMDGWEFLRLRKKKGILAKTPVIILSAFTNPYKKKDIQGYLKKPVNLDELTRVVERFSLDQKLDQLE